METATKYKYLERDQRTLGRPMTVKGTKIRVYTLYVHHVNKESPRSVEEIAADYSQVPPEAIREAIDYALSHQAEMREDLDVEDALLEASGMNDPNYRFHCKYKPLSAEDYKRIEAIAGDRR